MRAPLMQTSTTRASRRTVARIAAAYLLPALVASIALQSWFKPGTVIGGGDIFPPVNTGTSYQSHWNHVGSGEGQPSFAIGFLSQFEGQRAARHVGIGRNGFQRLFFGVVLAGVAASVVYFAFGLGFSPLASGIAGLFAVFNPLVMTSVPNMLPFLATTVAALLGGLIVRAGLSERRPSVAAFGLSSIGLSYVAQNPPHVVIVAMWLIGCVALVTLVGHAVALRRTIRFLTRAVALAVLLNLWWIVPGVLSLMSHDFGSRYAAGGPAALRWTHQRATLLNALTLNADWTWRFPEYVPIAPRLDRFPFGAFRLLLPALAAAGVLLARGRVRIVTGALACIGLVGVWLATGLRGPAPGVNQWLYDHMPGYFLFREPIKLLLLPMIAFTVLGGFAIGEIAKRARGTYNWSFGVAALAVIGVLAYAHPMFTGEVIPDRRPILPPSHVTIPSEWFQAARYVNSQPADGKLLVLPRSDFYQMGTNWGYYGVPFTPLMVRRPVLEFAPGGYFRPYGSMGPLMRRVEESLIQRRNAKALSAMKALGLRYVLLRHDFDVPLLKRLGRTITDADQIARGLDKLPHVDSIHRFGPLVLYRLDETLPGEVFASSTTSAAPKLRYSRVHPAVLRVEVRDAPGPFELVLTDAYSKGWRLEGAGPATGSLRHFREAGYANGWLLPRGGNYQLRLVYGPERFAALGRWLSLIGLLATLLIVFARPIVRRRGRVSRKSLSEPARDRDPVLPTPV
jgi:arabinofuranan 3-O-arabinosyltransferase